MPLDAAQTPETATTCPYCGVGCGVLVRPADDGQSAIVRGDPDHPSNFGKLCSKGSALGETLTLDERLLHPQVSGRQVGWDEALATVADGFRQSIEQYGPDSVAFYVSGQFLTEDYYVANKLMKGFIGSSNIDTNSRLCMASSVVGHKRAFGADTVPGCYEDLELSDLVVLVGSNFAWCHPVLHRRLLAAKENRNTKIVVIDPRRTATADAADLFLPINPGSDVALFNWLFWKLAGSQAYDADFVGRHTNGMSDALVAATEISDAIVQDLTGLDWSDLQTLLQWYVETPKTMTVYSQGVNQSSAGSDKVNAILNTHLVTGRIGKPGMGPFSITGQPNAMGGREVGGLANQLAAHMDFDAASMDRLERFWRAPNLSKRPGMKAIDLFDAVHDGRIKAIWIMATNPVVSMPQADKVKEALEKCPLVVVSDVSARSDTLQFANVQLPATAWGEKSGTVTNSERRISRQRSFLTPPGEARHDWWALARVATMMGYEGFDYASEADVFSEYAALTAFENNGSRDLDIGGLADLSRDQYDTLQPTQWPLPAREQAPGSTRDDQHRFFGEGHFYTPDAKANFIPTLFRAPKAPIDDYPFILNTGRIRDQWHTMTRTGKAPRLAAHLAEPFLQINPLDADRLAIRDADLACVHNHHGRAVLRVMITDAVRPGQLFAPMHWSQRYSSEGRVDVLVGPECDPESGQQESKFVPVKLEKFGVGHFVFGVFQEEPTSEILAKLEYWALAQAEDGWRLEAASNLSGETLVALLVGDEVDLRVSLPNGRMRVARIVEGVVETAVMIGGNTPLSADRTWLVSTLSTVLNDEARMGLLAGRPGNGQSTGPIICACEGVGQKTIQAAFESGLTSVSDVGKCTGAGTNCGSCQPELKALLEAFKAVELLEMEVSK